MLPYLIVLATYLPFLNQAYHIDDRIYLEIAENIGGKPLYPYDFAALFEGFVAPDAASHSHLPLTSYYLAGIQVLHPRMEEWVVHLAFLIFPLLAVYGFLGIAERFLEHAREATLLFATSTAFIVLSHTLMPDVPFIAFWLVSLRHFFVIAFPGQARRRDWLICGAALLGAGFLSLLSFGLILLYLAYPLILKRFTGETHRQWKGLAALAMLPFLLWFLWYLRGYLHYDRFVLINTFTHMESRSFLSPELLASKALSFVMNAGAVFTLPLLAWWIPASRSTRAVFLVFPALPVLVLSGWYGWHPLHSFLFGVFLSAGMLILWSVFQAGQNPVLQLICNVVPALRKEPVSTGDTEPSRLQHTAGQLLLILWTAGMATACLLVFYSGSVRYAFLAAPPVLILLLSQLETRTEIRLQLSRLLGVVALLSLAYSLAISYGDYLFAETYRRSSREICERFSREGNTVFYTGEWGFRFYMDRNGAQPITQTGLDARPGDIIVKPFVALPWTTLYDGDKYTELLEQRIVLLPYPVRIMDFASRAGFYSTGWGRLPFSLSTGEQWEWFNVFRVTRRYEGEIPSPDIPY